MVKMGGVDLWHFSPRCAAFSPRRRMGHVSKKQQRNRERRWLDEVKGTMEYVRMAQPTAVTIENVPQLRDGVDTWDGFRKVLASMGDYDWTCAVLGPEDLGSQAVRRRLWVIGVLRRPVVNEVVVGSKRKR